MLLRLLVVALTTAALVLPGAPATSDEVLDEATVLVKNFEFTPATVTVSLGSVVTWQFEDSTRHTATSTQGFWDSGFKGKGETYARRFGQAGTFPYLCTPHRSMVGRVRVPVTASGTSETGWTLRWANGSQAPKGTTYDVQLRRPGATRWNNLAGHKDTTRTSTTYDPVVEGSYLVRARVTRPSGESGWSPPTTFDVS